MENRVLSMTGLKMSNEHEKQSAEHDRPKNDK